MIHNLSLPQLLAIIPCEISSECSCERVNEVDWEKERAGAKANEQARQTIHHKAHLCLVTTLEATTLSILIMEI